MPFKFKTPDGPMEVTVRSGTPQGQVATQHVYAAAATFIGHGPRALERIRLTPNASSHSAVLKTLKTGFKVNPQAHDAGSLSFRVLTALCQAEGVTHPDD